MESEKASFSTVLATNIQVAVAFLSIFTRNHVNSSLALPRNDWTFYLHLHQQQQKIGYRSHYNIHSMHTDKRS